MRLVKRIEIFDVSAVAFALLGVGIEYEFRGRGRWLDLYANKTEDDIFVTALVEWTIHLSHGTVPYKFKQMAQDWVFNEGVRGNSSTP